MPATRPTSTWPRAHTQDVVVSYTVTDAHGATDTRDADHHRHRRQRRAGGGRRHRCGRPRTAPSPARSRANDSDVDDGERCAELRARCAGRRPDASTPTAATASSRATRPTSTWRPATPGRGRRATPSPTRTAPPTRATLTITVTGTNDAPVAVADTDAATEDSAIITARSRPTTATSMTASGDAELCARSPAPPA